MPTDLWHNFTHIHNNLSASISSLLLLLLLYSRKQISQLPWLPYGDLNICVGASNQAVKECATIVACNNDNPSSFWGFIRDWINQCTAPFQKGKEYQNCFILSCYRKSIFKNLRHLRFSNLRVVEANKKHTCSPLLFTKNVRLPNHWATT